MSEQSTEDRLLVWLRDVVCWRVRMRCADALLHYAGRGRGLWPWLSIYLWLLGCEGWIANRLRIHSVLREKDKCE